MDSASYELSEQMKWFDAEMRTWQTSCVYPSSKFNAYVTG